ncbi:MAG: TonB-dependent receptor [Bacteroidetes bacterium]|nr:TonB-dependent receptor [Bacteroidota bacterium]
MKIIFLLIPALLYSMDSFAQSEEPDTSSTNSLNEVIISANKSEETRRTISQQVQLIDSKQISLAQAQTTAELLSNRAGIFVQKSQMGGGSPVLRGFEANRILLVIDGVRQNNLIYRDGHLQNILSIDNNSLDRVEVLFGPSSTMYGSDALGGVVHLYTKAPQFAMGENKSLIKVNAFTRFGSANDEFTGHFDLNVGGTKFAAFTSFTHSTFDDLRGGTNQNPFYDGVYPERPYYVDRINGVDSLVKNADRYLQVQSGYSQFDLVQKFVFKSSEKVSHGLNLQYSTSSNIPRYDHLTDLDSSGFLNAEYYYGPQERLMTAYDMNYASGDGFFNKIHVGLSFQKIQESRNQRLFKSDNLQSRTEDVNVIGCAFDMLHIDGSHSMHFGLDGQFNSLKSTAVERNIVNGTTQSLDTRYPDGDNTMNSAAVYFSHSWKINDQVTLNDGFRVGMTTLHSTFKDTTFFKFPFKEMNQEHLVYSGSVGLIHVPNDDLKFSILLSTGFRAPNVDDLSKVFQSTLGSIVVPNEDLDPEQTINTEIGITKIYNGVSSWENTLYYTQFYNAIITDKFQYQGQDSIFYNGALSQVTANQNKGKAYIYGFSSSFRTRLMENLICSFSMNYTYGRVKTDSTDVPLGSIPPMNMRLGFNYSNANFSSDFFLNFNAAKKLKDYSLNAEDNPEYATADGMPAWFTINWRVSYQVHKLITIQVGIDNIFDTQYRTFASGINEPGRNIFGVLKFNF